MRFLRIFGIILLLLIGLYFIGPKPAQPAFSPALPVVPADPLQLEKYIRDHEAPAQTEAG